jgi:nucleoside-diphosphate-sugar epimerase
MKALVTGASGFIGSSLIEELGVLGFDVHALLRKTSDVSNLQGAKYKRLEGDLSDIEALKRAVKGMNYVFHLAGATAAPTREGYFEHNAHGTERLAEAVATECPGLTRFVYVSSLAAGGPVDGLDPRVEGQPDHPVSAYGESKLEAEKRLLKYKDVFPISIVRPPMVYGPRDKGVFVIIKTVSRNLMPILQSSTADGKKYYSMIHVKDLTRGVVQAGLAPLEKVPSGEIFYLAGDGVHSSEQLLTTIAESLGCDPLRIRVPKFVITTAAVGLTALGKITRRNFPLNKDKLNELLPDFWICSSEKAKKLLGFHPEFELGKGIAQSIEWYKKQGWI